MLRTEIGVRTIRWLSYGVFTICTLAIAAVLAPMVLLGLALLGTSPSPWNFPGDPAAFETILSLTGPVLAATIPLWLLMRIRSLKVDHLVVDSVLVMIAVSGLLFFAAAAGILERQDGRWAAVRHGIRQYGDAIAADVGGKPITSTEEFDRVRSKFIPKPVSVLLPGYGEVQLRMAHGEYPYVGVDFCCGGHALFDPRTMLVKYSD